MRKSLLLATLFLFPVPVLAQGTAPTVEQLQSQVRQLRIAHDQADFEAAQAEDQLVSTQAQLKALQEKFDALQKQVASKANGGSGPQPEVRKEGGSAPGSRPGVQSGRR